MTMDGETMCVPIKYMDYAIAIKDIYDATADAADATDAAIPVPGVTMKTFKKIVEFWDYISANPDVNRTDGEIKDIILNKWDKKYFDIPHSELRDLVVAANMLDSKALYRTCLKRMSQDIKSFPRENWLELADKIRDYLAIKNDFTPEEQDARIEEAQCLKTPEEQMRESKEERG